LVLVDGGVADGVDELFVLHGRGWRAKESMSQFVVVALVRWDGRIWWGVWGVLGGGLLTVVVSGGGMGVVLRASLFLPTF
jgi:hypothetical protein